MENDKMKKHREKADDTAEKQREIQKFIDQLEKKEQQESDENGNEGVQAGAREQPQPPLPKQKLEKPGLEKDLDLSPQYMAPDYKGSEKLKDKVAIITGADSGIGRAVAVLFAREGADVAVLYLNEDDDAEETKEAVEKEGQRAILISGDVSDSQFCQDAVEQTLSELDKIDILVNNAGFQEHAKSLEQITDAHFDMTMKTNLYGYFNMARAVIPHLREGSAIINTGSVNGFFGHKMLIDYSLTKGGIHAFTQSLAKNLADKGIRVNAVAPGPVWTPLNPADEPAEATETFGGNSSMNRPAQPEELSPSYVFLASPVCSSFITGHVLGVIGGVTE